MSRSRRNPHIHPSQVAIMKGYMTGGITDISPVIDSYTDALLDVYPQVGGRCHRCQTF